MVAAWISHPVSAGMASLPALVSPAPVQLRDGDDVDAGCSSRTTASARRPHRRTHIPASVAERWGSRAGGWARGANGIRGAGSALATQSRRSSRWERVGAGSAAPTHRGTPVIHAAAPRCSSQSPGHLHWSSPVSPPRPPAHRGALVTPIPGPLQLPPTREPRTPPAQPPGVTDTRSSPATNPEGTQRWDGSAGPKCDLVPLNPCRGGT